MKKFKKISALVLCFLMAMSACFIASADDVVIDPAKKGSINIVTYESKKDGGITEFGTKPATGKTATVPNGYTPLAGVTYTLYNAAGVSTGKTAVSNATGIASFANLDQGTYIIKATAYPVAATTFTIADMKVKIPMTNTDGTGVFYDVNVYPKIDTVYGTVEFRKTNDQNVGLEGAIFKLQWKKNGSWVDYSAATYTTDVAGKFTINNLPKGDYQLIETKQPSGYLLDTTPQQFSIGKDAANTTYDEVSKTYKTSKTFVNSNNPTISKSVDKDNQNIGGDVVWTITPSIPSGLANYQTYSIKDTLDAALSFKSVEVTTGTSGGTILTKGTDYECTATAGSAVVVVDMKAAGLAKIVGTFSIKITTTLKEGATDLIANGVKNGASLTFKNQFDTDSTTVTTNADTDPAVRTGGVNFTKTGENGAALAGATFKLYASEADAKAGANAITFYNKALTASATEVTSGDDGAFGFYGLKYGTYYMVETKAPSGYDLKGDVVAVTINADSYAAAATAVTNAKTDISLPFTGGIGAEVVVIGGVLMMAAAAFVLKKFAR